MDAPITTPDPRRRWGITPRLVVGIALIVLGVVYTLDNFDVLDARDVLRYWPVLVIAIGVAKLSQMGTLRCVAPWIWIGAGTLLLLHKLRWVHLRDRDIVPLVLIAIGLWILMRRLPRRAALATPGAAAAAGAGDALGWAVFGGVERRTTGDFRSGEVGALFGGFEVDLRGASMSANEAVIDVFAFCGGGDIKVPESWNVVVKVTPIFGGTDDKTHHPPPGEGVKQLVVTGVVIFGGVGLKN